MSELTRRARNSLCNQDNKHISLLTGPKRFGPITISNPRVATGLQIVIVTTYIFIILVSAFSGPKSFLMTIWRIGISLIIYAITIQYLVWKADAYSDMILPPVCYFGRKVLVMSGKMFASSESKGLVMVNAIDCVATDAKLGVNEV